ncbi:glycerol dehydrogenase [Achromobacter anxifer]|jgi:glycerol dehydrogenase|uniref:Glycerol dehydrogenase n=1 Tax=Achromobacter anxifer TaxID=1287737 RepID=A0A6S7ET61_9BURK|nr:glycerol dehydrogenase [Achromobacter anxifer]MDF8359585.1 glycerol dehydrogenase [Achromobacter anxifer]CAB3926203.1 Glycerol dehydrogenase [Achromobacter anxifer]
MLKIFGAPSRYIQGPGALDTLGQYAALFGRRAALVIDSYVHGVLGPRIEALCAAQQVSLVPLIVEGDLTPASIAQLRAQAAPAGIDMVIAVGGGKALDAGKAVAKSSHCHLITVPTVASNDAPTSKNYVLYDAHHNLLAVEHMLFNPSIVLVDTAVIATAPVQFFRAGLGDAVSKKFEAEQCGRNGGRNMYDAAPPLTAQFIADGCLRILLADGADAVAAAGSGQPTPAFERVVEAMILMSGLGFESGGLSIAHALTRGLPKISGVATAPHGLQVAVGLLVQLELENRSDDMLAELTRWYAQVGLPVTLRELGAADAPADAELRLAAELSLKARHAANFDRALDTDTLAAALRRRA